MACRQKIKFDDFLTIKLLERFYPNGGEAGICSDFVSDINNDSTINIVDVIFLVNIIFSS